MTPLVPETIIYTFAMGAVIFFCRVFPFLFFRGGKADGKRKNRFLLFVERSAPPLTMTVLCLNSTVSLIRENIHNALPVISASALTALLHLWRRNALLSIFSGTALFMLLQRLT
jgi:branched-subunit amino acid transport protein AzlD